MPSLPAYNEKTFRNKFVIAGVGEGALNVINCWWRQIHEKEQYLKKLEDVVTGLSMLTLEYKEVKIRSMQCREAFDNINNTMVSFIGSSDENLFTRMWREMITLFGKDDAKTKQISELADAIHRYKMCFETGVVGQMIAVAEAMNGTYDEEKIKLARQKIVQWGVEELQRSLVLLELKTKEGGISLSSTIDDLETEQMEISAAVAAELWNMEAVAKQTKWFVEVRHSMDVLKFEKEVKSNFDKLQKYALGESDMNISAMELLRLVEVVFVGFVNDNTLERYWEYQQEQLEEAIEQ